MNFILTQEEREFQKMMEMFAEKEVAPGAIERDQSESFDGAYEIIMNKMGPMGLLGLTMPVEYGGQGKSNVLFSLAMMEICRKDVSVGAAWSVCLSLGTIPILKFGSEELKEKYLPALLKGEKLCAFGLTELGAGSDAAMQQTTAVLDGDEYVINGSKVYITNAGYADTYVIIAMTDKEKGSKGGISAFVVEKDTLGFTFGEQYEKCGIHGTVQRELIFENCRIPKENIIGKEGDGFKAAMTGIDYGRIGVASQGVGCAWGALDIAVKRANEREQFGKPIAKNQAISFKLAEMATKVELAKLIVLKAADLASQGEKFTKYAAMAKKYCTDVAQQVAADAVQICGGHGYLRKSEIERFYRDAKILQIYEGTNEIQDMIISGYVLSGK